MAVTTAVTTSTRMEQLVSSAEAMFRAGLAAVMPTELVRRHVQVTCLSVLSMCFVCFPSFSSPLASPHGDHVQVRDDHLHVEGVGGVDHVAIPIHRNVLIVGFGKAAASMAAAAAEVLGDHYVRGVDM